MMTEITTTTTTTSLSIAAQFMEDFRYIEGGGGLFDPAGLYDNLFYAPARNERELEQQHRFLTGDYLNNRLIPRLNQILQPASEERCDVFIARLVKSRTKAGREEKEEYVFQLSRMVKNLKPSDGALEIALEDLFENSDGFLPTPISVKEAIRKAEERIQTLIRHINAMPETYQRGVVGLEADRRRDIEAERWAKEREAREAAELVKAQEEYQTHNEEHLKRYGFPLDVRQQDLREWYRGLLKLRGR